MAKEQQWHVLKSDPRHFRLVADGTKKFEVRVNDRDYQNGDILVLREYDRTRQLNVYDVEPKGYTGRTLIVRVTTLLDVASIAVQPDLVGALKQHPIVCMGIEEWADACRIGDTFDAVHFGRLPR